MPRASAKRRVLVVDDNVDAAEVLAFALETCGHETRTAGDGAAAVAAFEAWRPEVMLVDIGLPVLDGYEVARRVCAHPARPALLVAVTGYGQESDRRLSREAGFDAHLVKPVPLEEVEGLLARLPAK